MPHLLSLLDLSGGDITRILNRADVLSTAWAHNAMPLRLMNRRVGLWFYGEGFRNRVAFDIGARAMGASVAYIPGELGVHEPIEDIGHYLGNWFSMLVVRAKRHADLVRLSETAGVSVVNARTDMGHPCEILGDLQFIRRRRGSLDGLNVVFAGEVTNLCMSWFEAAARLPITVTQAAPEGYGAGDALLRRLNDKAVGRICVNGDLDALLPRADLVYTDCWPRAANDEDAQRIEELFLPYQITGKRLRTLKDGAIFLPCPPVTRGQEVSHEAMESPLCMNYAAKACLLHSQNAIMEHCAGVLD